MDLNNKSVLITGGTGSLGQALCNHIRRNFRPKKVIIYSRDEQKQSALKKIFTEPFFRWFIGDVKDLERLLLAMEGVQIVIHAAAMKHIDICEHDPLEAVKTNIFGTNNVLSAVLKTPSVEKAVFVSTDKAVNPINLYGTTKSCAEKLWIAGNTFRNVFNVVRYGNVVSSKGGVFRFFQQLDKNKIKDFPITDERMNRFVVTFDDAIYLIGHAIDKEAGVIFVLKCPAVTIKAIAKAVNSRCRFKIVGIRPSEKISEILVSEAEAKRCYDFDKFYQIYPEYIYKDDYLKTPQKKLLEKEYNSKDVKKMSISKLKSLVSADMKKYPLEVV